MTDDDFVRSFQARAQAAGLYHGAIDGDPGPMTLAALDRVLPPPLATAKPPWITAAAEALGWHETRDNARLAAWLKRDGMALGNPAALPWCGDFCQSALALGLPGEELPGDLGRNPFWALHWRLFGRRVEPGYGVIAVKPRTGGGHVTFLVGEDATDFYCLGGNQSDSVSVARFPKSAFTDFRWPKSYPHEPGPLPRLSPGTTPRSPSEV